MSSQTDFEEKYAPKAYFTKLVGFTYQSLETFCRDNGIDYEDNLPVFLIMRKLKDKTKYVRASSDLKGEKEYEEVITKRIKNQRDLGQLVPIAEAKNRVRDVFLAVAKYIRYGAKSASLRVAICSNARDCENIMLNEYDNALDMLQKVSKVITWEQDSGENKLARTELAAGTGEDTSDGSDTEVTTSAEG